MERKGLDVLILTTPESIFYATGFYCWSYHGRACGNTIAVVPKTGKISLILSQYEQDGALLQTKGKVHILPYAAAMYIEDYYDPNETEKVTQPDPNRTFKMAAEVAREAAASPRVGVERGALPYDRFLFLSECFGMDNLFDLAGFMRELRKIKLPWEVEALRDSAQTAERMMNITMQLTQVGMTEADIFKIWYQSGYEITGGHEICHINQVHATGKDFWATLLPRETPLEDGDIVRLDGGLTLYGYVSDIGRSYAVGDPAKVSDEKKAIYETLLKAYDSQVSRMVPGAKMSDIFNETMAVCRKGALPNFVRGHFGHSISLGPSPDYPMISPTCDEVLEPGMVFCIEFPYYSTRNCSFNLEDTLVITENGPELFTHVNRSLFI